MEIKDFIFPLKQRHISQQPHLRGSCRLLVAKRFSIFLEHKRFGDIIDYLNPGDVIVLNDSRVIPTRLWGILDDSRQKEITLIQKIGKDIWTAYIRPETKLKKNRFIWFDNRRLKAKLIDKTEDKRWRVKFFETEKRLYEFLSKNAEINLPFYLRFQLKDIDRYQTVYARHPGSCQPPTAGLDFTRDLLNNISRRGIHICYITLHISGSLLPLIFNDLKRVKVGEECYTVPEDTARTINKARLTCKKIVAVGTTVMRALESAADNNNTLSARSGWTGLTILPGHRFRIVDAFLTNFHMPGSSHLMLTAAFGGVKNTLKAYNKALRCDYEFLDFGDSMLII